MRKWRKNWRKLAQVASLNMMEKHKVKIYIMGATEATDAAVSRSTSKGTSQRGRREPPQNASWLQLGEDDGFQDSASSTSGRLEAEGSAASAALGAARGRGGRKGEVALGSRGRGRGGAAPPGVRPVAASGAPRGAYKQRPIIEALLAYIPLDKWEKMTAEMLGMMSKGVLGRDAHAGELARSEASLELLLRTRLGMDVAEAEKVAGDEDDVLDWAQGKCWEAEGGQRNGGGLQQGRSSERGGAASGGPAAATTFVLGGGTSNDERKDADIAMAEALATVENDPKLREELEALARMTGDDTALAARVAAFGANPSVRPLLYKANLVLPAGTIASGLGMKIIHLATKLRLTWVSQLAAEVRPLIPVGAGTTRGLPQELAEAVVCGRLMHKMKLQRLFQPDGGSQLLGGKKKGGDQSPGELLSRGIFAIAVAYHGAHGHFDVTAVRAFAGLHSECLDATQKGVAADQAAGLVLEPVLGDLERMWELAANSMGERPIVATVASELKDSRVQRLGMEIAAAAGASKAPTPAGGKASEVDKLKTKLEAMKKDLAEARASGKGKPGGGTQRSGKESPVEWRARKEAWEVANEGRCWFQTHQAEGCNQKGRCKHAQTHPGHTQD